MFVGKINDAGGLRPASTLISRDVVRRLLPCLGPETGSIYVDFCVRLHAVRFTTNSVVSLVEQHISVLCRIVGAYMTGAKNVVGLLGLCIFNTIFVMLKCCQLLYGCMCITVPLVLLQLQNKSVDMSSKE